MNMDPSTDYMGRSDVYASNLPSGASVKDFIHYGQLVHTNEPVFKRYDYGSDELNMLYYNQTTVPDYDLSLLDFPIAMFGGKNDILADLGDVEWLHGQLSKTVVFYHQYNMGHSTFAIGKDMSFFEVDAMSVLNHYNNKCSPETANSHFTEGNQRCQKGGIEIQDSFIL